jgi:ferredoxin
MRCVAVCPSKAIDMNSSIVLNGWIERYKTFRKAKQKEMMQKMHEKMLQRNEPKHNTMEETPPEMTIVQPEVAALPESQTVLCLEDHSEENPTENEIIIIEDYGADNGDNQPFNAEECQLSEQVRLDAALSDTEVSKPSEDRD